MSDVCVLIGDTKLNLRVGALIVHDSCILICRLPEAAWGFVPGGRVKANETSVAAIHRELNEEIGPSFRVRNARVVSENFFVHEGVRFHELCTYYVVEWFGSGGFTKMEGAAEEFEWLRSEDLEGFDLKPTFLKRIFRELDSPLELVIHGDKEDLPNQSLQPTALLGRG
jgi:ADP-ribose pyrophosphatase YjhB (NUDIX family)